MPDGSTSGVAAATSAPAGAGAAAAPRRDRSRDGWKNRLEYAVLTRFRPVWEFVNARPALAQRVNAVIVKRAAGKVPARPLALSTAAPYTSWASLNDRGWFGRYLPPAPPPPDLPSPDKVSDLFKVGPEGPRPSRRSTLLFPSFAQWFTDGFLMTVEGDRKRTDSNHQIDLSQVYGLDPEVTEALRLRSGEPGEKGRLKSVVENGEEWAPRLYDRTGGKRAEFGPVPDPERMPKGLPLDRKAGIFAFGGRRSNATPFTAMVSTLFLREHNRLCKMLEAANPGWDDDRVFETARNINIVLLIKVVIEEYINHISPYWFRLLGDPRPCYKADWNRQNWIPVEFNLLYRWHSAVPETVDWGGAATPIADTRFNNRFLLDAGLGAAFANASRTAARQIGLFNTPAFLLDAEKASVQQGRDNQLASYNDYREETGYPRVTRFEQINGDPRVVAGLRDLYGHVDRVDFFVGLFAEEARERSAVPALIGRMVAADAFSHALTNALLSPLVFNERTFTPEGLRTIADTSSLQHLLDRNTGERPPGTFRATMEQGR